MRLDRFLPDLLIIKAFKFILGTAGMDQQKEYWFLAENVIVGVFERCLDMRVRIVDRFDSRWQRILIWMQVAKRKRCEF